MFVEFPSGFFHRVIRAAASGRWAHNLFHADFGSAPVVSRHTVTDVALSDDPDQVEFLFVLNHRRATAIGFPHRLRGTRRRVFRRAARRGLDWFHDLTTTTHFRFLLWFLMPKSRQWGAPHDAA
jgi:hypothetical protein